MLLLKRRKWVRRGVERRKRVDRRLQSRTERETAFSGTERRKKDQYSDDRRVRRRRWKDQLRDGLAGAVKVQPWRGGHRTTGVSIRLLVVLAVMLGLLIGACPHALVIRSLLASD